MNKKAIIPILLCSMLFSGCSLSKYFSVSSIDTVVLYEESNAVAKEDIASGKYTDIMLPSYITDLSVTKNDVLQVESRTLISQENNALVYYPQCSASDTLGNWIKSSNCEFKFQTKKSDKENPTELYVASYAIKNYGSSNTFGDYLSVMSALSQHYGECTIELYKAGSSVVAISEMQQSMNTQEIIDELTTNFEKGALTLEAQWIDRAYDIKVHFNSPSDCSVVYTLKI